MERYISLETLFPEKKRAKLEVKKETKLKYWRNFRSWRIPHITFWKLNFKPRAGICKLFLFLPFLLLRLPWFITLYKFHVYNIVFLLLYTLQCAHHENLVSIHHHTVDPLYPFHHLPPSSPLVITILYLHVCFGLFIYFGFCLWTFSIKGHIVNILGFVGHTVSVTSTLFCHSSTKGATNIIKTNGHGYDPIQLYLQKWTMDQIWPASHSLLTPEPEEV